MNFWVEPLNVLFLLEGIPPPSWLDERATRLSPLLGGLMGDVRLMLPGFAKAGKPPKFYLTSKCTSGELSAFILLIIGGGLCILISSRAAYARMLPVAEFFFSLKILASPEDVSKLFGDRPFYTSF
jgi:hypothetical protein